MTSFHTEESLCPFLTVLNPRSYQKHNRKHSTNINMAAEVIDKGKDKASRKVRKFLVKQLQQVTKELGGLAAQDWEVCKN